MPKVAAFLGFLLCCILAGGQAFALSDAEYNSLAKNSAEFRQADKELNKYWKLTLGHLDGDYKMQILNDQRQWVKHGWDKTAQKFMAQGMSKSAAYTKAIHERINQLRVIQENSALSENEGGRAKADDYYNAQDDQNTSSNIDNFFANEAQIYDMAEDVIIEGEKGGIAGLLQQADKSKGHANSDKYSWLCAVQAMALYEQLDNATKNNGELKNNVLKALAQTAKALGISKEEMLPFMERTTEVLRVASDRVASATEKEEGIYNDAAHTNSDAYHNTSENTGSDNTKTLLGKANGDRQPSEPDPMPQMSKSKDYLMEQNLKSQQNLLGYLDVVNNTDAKVQKASGRAYPILPVLSKSIEEYGQFDSKLAQAMMAQFRGEKLTEPKQILDAMNSAWNSIGYSMEATCSQLFKTISPRQYLYLTGHKVMNLCIPIIQFFRDDKLLKTALENGYISKEAAVGYIEASLRYYKAMEKVDNDGVRLPK